MQINIEIPETMNERNTLWDMSFEVYELLYAKLFVGISEKVLDEIDEIISDWNDDYDYGMQWSYDYNENRINLRVMEVDG